MISARGSFNQEFDTVMRRARQHAPDEAKQISIDMLKGEHISPTTGKSFPSLIGQTHTARLLSESRRAR